jgi:hypothetical protein
MVAHRRTQGSEWAMSGAEQPLRQTLTSGDVAAAHRTGPAVVPVALSDAEPDLRLAFGTGIAGREHGDEPYGAPSARACRLTVAIPKADLMPVSVLGAFLGWLCPLAVSALCGAVASGLMPTTAFGQTPEIYQANAERYAKLKVADGSGEARAIFVLESPFPEVGDIWHLTAEIHVTNDELRDRGRGVACTTEIRVAPDRSNDRSGVTLLRANGTFNVGVEAHHGPITRSIWIEWTQEMVDKVERHDRLYVKFFAWAHSTAAERGDELTVTRGRGFLQLVVFRS